MSRYIDADRLISLFISNLDDEETLFNGIARRFVKMLRDSPSIDIVFCNECKHRTNDDDFQEGHICLKRRANGGKYCNDNDFCSYGERREL